MSDTPETDALMDVWRVGKLLSVGAMLDHSRKLERERDEAREQLRLANIDFFNTQAELEAMIAKASGWQNQAELNARLLVECREKAERYRLEANAMMAHPENSET